MKPIAVYIHVPFCARKCVYCDFASYSGKEGIWDSYFNALYNEIDQWRERLHDRTVCSVFFGGGTPSLVPYKYIVRTMETLRKCFVLSENAEITIEANPGTVAPEKLKAYRDCGVNRISFGVQSFDDDLLKSLGRIHSADTAIDSVRLAKNAGFDNLSIDLMYGLPGQSMLQWKNTLLQAMELPISHISAYSLIVEEGTAMSVRVESGEAVLPEEDTTLEMQRMATAMLRAKGLQRYEISNYAYPGKESAHNMTYWSDGEYIGFGCAAHSLVDNQRFSNPAEPEQYISGIRTCEQNGRTLTDHMEEVIMLSTRTVRGLSLKRWKDTFSTDFEILFAKQIRKMCNYGFAELEDGFFCLTEPGMELQDSVVLEFIEEL